MIAIRLQFTKQSVVSSSTQHFHSLRVKHKTTQGRGFVKTMRLVGHQAKRVTVVRSQGTLRVHTPRPSLLCNMYILLQNIKF